MTRILIDSGFLIALHNPNDVNHVKAVEFARTSQDGFRIPVVVLPEVAYVLRREGGMAAVSLFLRSLAASGIYLEQLSLVDIIRAEQIMMIYPEARLDLVDCCIVAIAERQLITHVCTFDRRDFSIIRPQHSTHLEILP